MAKSDKSLLAQVEDAALDSTTSLADALRKCVSLGGQAGSEELRDWARRELDGYRTDDDLPDYRVLPGVVKIDGTTFNAIITGQQLSTFDIPEFAREQITSGIHMRQGIAELELISKSGSEVKLQHPGMPDLVAWMNSEQPSRNGTITSMYWVVGAASVHGAVDAVRTKLVALVAEMRAAGATGSVVPADVAEQAVHVVIHGAKRSPITVNTAIASTGGSASADLATPATEVARLPSWIRGPWGFAVGLGTLVAAYTGIAAGTGWPPF